MTTPTETTPAATTPRAAAPAPAAPAAVPPSAATPVAATPTAPAAPTASAAPARTAPSQGRRPGARDASDAPESVKRKMLMGGALLLALASIYAGLLEAGRLAQVMLAMAATIAVVWALTSRSH